MENFQQLAAMGIVFSLLGGALFWLRRRNMVSFNLPRRVESKVRVLDRIRLTPQHSIHVVSVGRDHLIIAVHASGCTLLKTMPANIEGE